MEAHETHEGIKAKVCETAGSGITVRFSTPKESRKGLVAGGVRWDLAFEVTRSSTVPDDAWVSALHAIAGLHDHVWIEVRVHGDPRVADRRARFTIVYNTDG